jgi:hypothetical protein
MPTLSAAAPTAPQPRKANMTIPLRNRVVEERMVIFLFCEVPRKRCLQAIVPEKRANGAGIILPVTPLRCRDQNLIID